MTTPGAQQHECSARPRGGPAGFRRRETCGPWRAQPAADLHVRGNNITLAGSSADVAMAERVISELIAVVAGGQTFDPDAVRHSVGMVAARTTSRPAEVLTLDILSSAARPSGPRRSTRSATSTPSTPMPPCSASESAGTGRRYLAMAKGGQRAATKQVNRIIDSARGGSR